MAIPQMVRGHHSALFRPFVAVGLRTCKGWTDAINKGFACARGGIVIVSDSEDDYHQTNFVIHAVQNFQVHPGSTRVRRISLGLTISPLIYL
jgi:hypothetical protein